MIRFRNVTQRAIHLVILRWHLQGLMRELRMAA